MRIRQVTPAELAYHWRRIEPMFASALQFAVGRYEPIDLLVLAGRGVYQGWFIEEDAPGNGKLPKIIAVVLTTLVVYPRRKCCSIFLIAGDRMAEWIDDLVETMATYAREQGCDHLEGQGRNGWGRVVPSYRRICGLFVQEL
jgi:hypothetical protein